MINLVPQIQQFFWLGLILGASFMQGAVSQSQNIDPDIQKQIDDIISNVYMPAANISKLGLSIVRDNGEVVYSRGFGMADEEKGIPNGNKTQFLIGSTTKSFTATVVIKALHERFPGMGENVLDTPIRQLIPSANFTSIDRFRTEHATFRDLLGHRMCISRDDLQLLAGAFTTTSEIVYRQRYAEEICGMRSEWLYNDQMFVIAGELIGILTNSTYTELMDNLLKDIGMLNSSLTSNSDDFSNMPFRGQPYYVMDNVSHPFNVDLMKRVVPSNAAGGLYTTPDDMVKYMKFHLNKGNVDGNQIIPQEVMAWLTKPTGGVVPEFSWKSDEDDLVISTFGYGLGLLLASFDGWEYVHHAGYMPPYSTLMSLFPSQKLGIFTTSNEGPVMVDAMLVHAFIFDIFRGKGNVTERVGKLWDKLELQKVEKRMSKEKALKAFLEENTNKRNGQASEIVGRYGSGGSGDVEISEKLNNQTNTTGLYVSYGKWYKGWLENIGGSIYQIMWDTDVVQDRYVGGDPQGRGYVRVENETLEFIDPNQDDYFVQGRFKLGVSLDVLPPIPYDQDSC